MIETRTFDGETFQRFSTVDEFAAWAIANGWTDFEAQTGNAIAVIVSRRRWVRSWTDVRHRRRFSTKGHTSVIVLES